jgi:STE24 endopeptidase
VNDAIYSPQELVELRAYVDPIYLAGAIHELLIIAFWVVCLRFLVVRFYVWSESTAGKIESRFPRARTLPFVRALPAVLDRVWGGSGWGAALLFTMVLFLTCDLVWMPADFYFGFIRERAFGLSDQSLGRFGWDYLKAFILDAGTIAAVAFGMFGLARRLQLWWLIIGCVGAFALAFSAALDPYRAQLFVDHTPLPAGEVRDAISALMHKAKIDFKDVVLEKTLTNSVRVQAYFAGKGPTRTIVVNDALLKNLTTDEVVAAVGHEAGHVHESRWAGQLASTLALLAFLFVIEQLFRLVARRRWWGVTGRADIRAFPLILAVFGLCNLMISPFSAAFQREREREADQYGLQLTQDTDAFRRMLIKAARVNKMDPAPPRWCVLKGWSHPPIRERLDALAHWKKTDDG